MPKVDPLAGPLEVSLERFNRQSAELKTKVFGRVVDASGAPVVGAKVEPEGIQRGTGGSWGALKGVDPLAITDENGEFLLTAQEPFDALHLIIEARGLAKLRRNGLAPDQEHVITLTEGASVTGRVLAEGKPLPNVAVGIAGANRMAGEFVGYWEIGTDDQGRFLFPSLPTNTEYFVYGIARTLHEYGAIPAKKVRAQGDGTVTDIGDLTIGPGLRLAGQVVLSDGANVPDKTRVTVGFDDAWDAQYAEVDGEGRFEIKGIPPKASLSVSTRVKEYRFSGRNASLDPWNPFSLVGRLDVDKTDLVILLEPGSNLQPNRARSVSPDDHPRGRPLRGAEVPTDLSDYLVLAGRVLDAETEEAIDRFQVTPGSRSNRPNKIAWETHRTEVHQEGHYRLLLPKRAHTPQLLVEADGYLPTASPPFSASDTNFVFKLKKGDGPRGRVLDADGKPAGGEFVFRVDPGEQISLLDTGEIRAYLANESRVMSDPDGFFSFPPRLETGKIYVATEAGYAEHRADASEARLEVRLQSWGRIEGKLMQDGKPVAHETVGLNFARSFNPDEPWVNLQHAVKTDAEGRFTFERVPPGELNIVTRQPIDQQGLRGGWMNVPQATVTVKPGESATIEMEKKASGIRAGPSVPRATIIEKLGQKK